MYRLGGDCVRDHMLIQFFTRLIVHYKFGIVCNIMLDN